MKKVMFAAAAVATGASAAHAGGVERSAFASGFLFEEGDYVELSFATVSPDVSGEAMTMAGPAESGDMADGYTTGSLAYKQQLNDTWALGLVLDQPIGANVAYPEGTGYPFAGATAVLDAYAVTGLAKYSMPNNVSVYGGIKAEQVQGDIGSLLVNLDTTGGFTPGIYELETDTSTAVGYLVGVAWEKPEIAARVALTYESERTHELSTQESVNGTATAPDSFEITVPESLTLEFQSGVAEDTLIFGSIRYVDWPSFVLPAPALGVNLVEYTSATTTYNLGVGRRFNENWAGAITVGYEAPGGEPVGNLGPTDGNTSIGLAATYTMDNVKITGGVRYIALGDATTTTIGAEFEDNHAIAAGLRVGYSF